jgi:hypothetical protein
MIWIFRAEKSGDKIKQCPLGVAQMATAQFKKAKRSFLTPGVPVKNLAGYSKNIEI